MHQRYIQKTIRIFNQLRNRKIQALLLLDFVLLPLALLTSVLLRLGGNWDHSLDSSIWIFFVLPLWTIPIFINFGLYKAVIKYLDEKIILIVFIGVSLSVLILCTIIQLYKIYAFPLTSIIIFWVFALAYIGGTRIILRGILRRISNQNKTNIAIYGAGEAGAQLCLTVQNGNEYNPVAFFDDKTTKWWRTIRGISIYSPKELPKIIKEKNIHQILLAIPSLSITRKKEILDNLAPLSLKIKTLPDISKIINGEITINDIKEVEIEDLLSREPIIAAQELLERNIKNKIVLITGAGGSIGSELARQIAELKPNLLILFDVAEFLLYSIEKFINTLFPELKCIAILGSVTDENLVTKVLTSYPVNTIYHAAAYKHVPIVEYNPIAGIQNNVFGTFILAKLALKTKVNTMVLISTDKAVRSTNVMGASKRLSEIILQSLNAKESSIPTTVFTIVRFGNVLGSSGSVVPLFKEQIKAGGPITLTHKDIIRYLMTITEAVGLVIQASNMATGGEVFVLDMGKPVKILDLAIRMIHLSGLNVKYDNSPKGDIAIKITGLRPGEKLYEELLIANDPIATEHPRIMKARENFIEYEKLNVLLEDLEKATKAYNLELCLDIVKKVVDSYNPQHASNYSLL